MVRPAARRVAIGVLIREHTMSQLRPLRVYWRPFFFLVTVTGGANPTLPDAS
jgi:hypothetical protein